MDPSRDLVKSVLRTYDLSLMRQAVQYDLDSKEERLRSNKDLEALYFNLLKIFAPQLFIEAGAKDAGSSRRARKRLPGGRVVAFEANPHTHRRFAKVNAAANAVEYLHLALDRAPGTVTFNVRERPDGKPHADGQASLGKRFDHAAYQEVTVPSTSLDAFFADHAYERCALWIDVEGASEQVLAGARDVLQKACLAIIEVEDRLLWQDQTWRCFQVMECFFDAGLVPIARDFQSRYQYNVVFARQTLLDDDRFRWMLAAHWSELSHRPTRPVRKLTKLAREWVASAKERYLGGGKKDGSPSR